MPLAVSTTRWSGRIGRRAAWQSATVQLHLTMGLPDYLSTQFHRHSPELPAMALCSASHYVTWGEFG